MPESAQSDGGGPQLKEMVPWALVALVVGYAILAVLTVTGNFDPVRDGELKPGPDTPTTFEYAIQHPDVFLGLLALSVAITGIVFLYGVARRRSYV